MPFRKLFLSRWSALLWAGGILWTAEDTVGFGPPATFAASADAPDNMAANTSGSSNDSAQDATGVSVDAADLATLANAMDSR